MDDTAYMQRALELALQGQGFVHPNPMVGCVIIKGGRIIGEGYHQAFGGPHAEIHALQKAGAAARGATLYVNLEPCAHWGKTPPCMEAVAKAGIKRVVIAMRDPNPRVAGRGISFLRARRIAVTVGVLEKEARELNRAFIQWITRHRPYVTLKAAVSLDGKIATSRGESRWITGSRAREMGHRLRAQVDAIAVGSETILADDPSLTAHGKGRNPVRVLFDSYLRIPLSSQVMKQNARTCILCTSQATPTKRRLLEKKGISTYQLPASSQGKIDVQEALTLLAREGIAHLLVEGGGTLNASFLEAGLVDEVVWFVAPILIGGAQARTAFEGQGFPHMAQVLQLRDVRVEIIDRDLVFRGKVNASHVHRTH